MHLDVVLKGPVLSCRSSQYFHQANFSWAVDVRRGGASGAAHSAPGGGGALPRCLFGRARCRGRSRRAGQLQHPGLQRAKTLRPPAAAADTGVARQNHDNHDFTLDVHWNQLNRSGQITPLRTVSQMSIRACSNIKFSRCGKVPTSISNLALNTLHS